MGVCCQWRMYRDIYSQWPIIEEIIEFYGLNAEELQPIAGVSDLLCSSISRTARPVARCNSALLVLERSLFCVRSRVCSTWPVERRGPVDCG